MALSKDTLQPPEFIIAMFMERRGKTCIRMKERTTGRIFTVFPNQSKIFVGCTPKDIVTGSEVLIVIRNESIDDTYIKRAYPLVERLALLNGPKGAVSLKNAKQMIIDTIKIKRSIVRIPPPPPYTLKQSIPDILHMCGMEKYIEGFKISGIDSFERASILTIQDMKNIGVSPEDFNFVANLFWGSDSCLIIVSI